LPVIRAPDAPSGWPIEIAPPSMFTLDGSRPNSEITAKLCEENASFNSITSIDCKSQPAFSITFLVAELGLDPSKVNIDGGAISIGHPLGASGARIIGKAASILSRTHGNRALATMCIGGGMGAAIALEKI